MFRYMIAVGQHCSRKLPSSHHRKPSSACGWSTSGWTHHPPASNTCSSDAVRATTYSTSALTPADDTEAHHVITQHFREEQWAEPFCFVPLTYTNIYKKCTCRLNRWILRTPDKSLFFESLVCSDKISFSLFSQLRNRHRHWQLSRWLRLVISANLISEIQAINGAFSAKNKHLIPPIFAHLRCVIVVSVRDQVACCDRVAQTRLQNLEETWVCSKMLLLL